MLELSPSLASPTPHPRSQRAPLAAEMMVSLPSASPLNQSVGSDCPQLHQPFWPPVLRCFQRSASHPCTSLRQLQALKWNLVSPTSYLFVFISRQLDVLTQTWSFTAQTSTTAIFSPLSAQCPFYIEHFNLDILYVSADVIKTHTHDTWLRNRQLFWAQV